MALIISQQPATDSLYAAYNPIPFVVFANQPTSGDPSPIVFADIYIDGFYYGTLSTTVYHALVGPYAEYHFDIQDKIQEVLESQLLLAPLAQSGYAQKQFASCQVKFRETDIDSGGFTVSVGTEPQQATYLEDSVAGGGTASNEFNVLNCSLKHTDNIDLLTHLKKYTAANIIATDSGWNLSHRPNEILGWNYKNGGGKYYVCKHDHDVMTFFTLDNMQSTISGFVTVEVTYIDGSTSSQTEFFSAFNPFGANINSSHYFNAGVPNLQSIFPSLSFNNALKYMVLIGDILVDYCSQTYYIQNNGCCNERIRVFFQNLLGGFDAINMTLIEGVNKTESTAYLRNKSYIYPDKKERGLGRMQPTQVDYIECYTEDYGEQDEMWLKELLGTSQAYIQVAKDPLQNETSEFHPIVILDGEVVTRKKDDNFVTTISIKYRYANEVINLR